MSLNCGNSLKIAYILEHERLCIKLLDVVYKHS